MAKTVLGGDGLERVGAFELVPGVVRLPELAAQAVEVRVARLGDRLGQVYSPKATLSSSWKACPPIV